MYISCIVPDISSGFLVCFFRGVGGFLVMSMMHLVAQASPPMKGSGKADGGCRDSNVFHIFQDIQHAA